LGLAAAFLIASALPAAAQSQKDKKKKKDADTEAPPTSAAMQMPDEQQIDFMISEMLGAWQLADVEKLHKNYADDVSVVNGAYAPPIFGWGNFLAGYQAQRAHMQQVRLDRQNTYIRVNGNIAWACYQWDFLATVDGQPTESKGQTTLVMEKHDNRWIIVHNHTSLAWPQSGQATPSSTPAKAQPQATKPGAQ
jgi:uncharacterized protein (TIGR02246 family)